MKAEIITIGDELVYGQTLDTNSFYLAQKLTGLGIEVAYKTTVGDDLKKIVEAFKIGLERANVVIATGGLGPTPDDVTKKAILKVFNRKLIFHNEVLKKIEESFKKRGLPMPKINQNQALLPQGAKILHNPVGLAPGLLIAEDKKLLIALPGVPKEMKAIFEEELVLWLQEKAGKKVISHKKLRTTGIPESTLYEQIKDLLKGTKDLKVAFLPGYQGVDLRLSATAESEEKARDLMLDLEKRLKDRLQSYIYGEGEESLEAVVAKLLSQKKLTLSVAESCTGGMLAAKLTSIPGSSDYFERGLVTYSNHAKVAELGVPENLIKKFGAVSAEVACAMAEGVRKVAHTNIGISITGIAGPGGGSEDKPVGLVYIGLSSPPETKAEKFVFSGDRSIIRESSTTAALNILRLYLLSLPPEADPSIFRAE